MSVAGWGGEPGVLGKTRDRCMSRDKWLLSERTSTVPLC